MSKHRKKTTGGPKPNPVIKFHKATGIPILDKPFLLNAPVGSEFHVNGQTWRKNDENELITRKMARAEMQSTLAAFHNDITKFLIRNHTQNQKVESALNEEYAERRSIFAALLFVGDETWETGLELLRNRYNKAASRALDEVRKFCQQRDDDPAMVAAITRFEQALLSNSSDINGAARKAIAEGDKGAALKQLSTQLNVNILDDLRELVSDIRTEGIATDRRFSRALVWIGWQCNKMENTGQTDDIETMWKTLHRRLSVRRDELWGDELAAFNWFTAQLRVENTRQTNKYVSGYKQDMKPYYEERATQDRTQDR